MSSDLSVKIQPPLDNGLLLQDAARIFSEMLGVGFVMPFRFWGSSIGSVEIGYSVCFDEMELEEQPPWITSEQAGTYAFVTTNGNHGIPYAVAASVILAVAYKHSSNVIDNGSRWVKFPHPLELENDRGCSAATFQKAVTNSSAFADLEAAASAFYKRLPNWVADPSWTN